VKGFAVALVIVMTGLNIAGSTLVAKVQSLIVFVVVGILAFFAVVTIAEIDPTLIAPATYPSVRDIVSGVALTFFAFLGFGVVTFTAKDLKDPSRQLPRAMTIAIGLATVIYIAVSLGVLGTLGVEKVIEAGPTAIAVAAQPVLGDLGYWLMLITALFATSGATNAGLYPAAGLTEHLTSTGQWPTGMGGKIGPAPVGLLLVSVGVIAMVLFFDLDAIASIGSAVALLIFGIVSFGHLRIRADTGANLGVLVLAVVTVTITFLTFAFTTLIKEPASIATLVGIVIASAILDVTWSRSRERGATASA
jgi:amino acid transporter